MDLPHTKFNCKILLGDENYCKVLYTHNVICGVHFLKKGLNQLGLLLLFNIYISFDKMFKPLCFKLKWKLTINRANITL